MKRYDFMCFLVFPYGKHDTKLIRDCFPILLSFPFSKNQLVCENDIADVVPVNFGGLKIPDDCGLIFIYLY
jgi:hypothetical protein